MTRREAIRLGLAAGAGPVLLGVPPAAAIRLDELKRLERAAVSASIGAEQTTKVAFEAIANGGLLNDRTTAVIRILLDHAGQHADALAKTFHDDLGEEPPLAPKRTSIPGLGSLHRGSDALRFAERLQADAIATHLATVRRTKKSGILELLGGTVASDAQGLVLLRQLLRQPPAPSAFERGSA